MFQGRQPEADFKKAVRHAWKEHRTQLNENFKRVNQVTYERLLESIERDHPGATRAQLRKHLAKVADWWSAALMQNKDGKLQERLAVMQKWHDRMEKAAFDPEYQAQLAETFFGEDRLLQYIDEMFTGMAEFFCCRSRSCRAFFPSG